MNETIRLKEWVEPEWLLAHLEDPKIRIIECSNIPEMYDYGHLPNACRLDWRTDLLFDEDPQISDGLYFAYLCARRGIAPETVCVFYGESENRQALRALRIFRAFGHTQVKILRGGRERWLVLGYPVTLRSPIYPGGCYRAPQEVVTVPYYANEL